MLIERWDGTRWARVSVPDPPGVSDTALKAVSCPSASSCFAIGDGASSNSRPSFVERWDGIAWSAQVLAGQAYGNQPGLAGISCASASACVAIGTSFTADSDIGSVLAEHWDGTSWTIVPIAKAAGALDSQLSGISCVSNICTTVGSSETATARRTLVERHT